MATKEEYILYIKKELSGLTWKQKIHSINRLYEKIRLLHNSKANLSEKKRKEFLMKWNPIHDAVCQVRARLLKQMKSFSKEKIDRLVLDETLILYEDDMGSISYHDSKNALRNTLADKEIDLEEE